MKRHIYVGALIALSFSTFTVQSIKAIEPISIALSTLAIVGISKGIDSLMHLFGPSKSDRDFKQRHEELLKTSRDGFVASILIKRQIATTSNAQFVDQEILMDHELYRHPAFIEAAKEHCPDYGKYIKALMIELNNNTKARIVRGFETDHLYHKGAVFFKKSAKDFSQFYTLIQKLHTEVLLQEHLP